MGSVGTMWRMRITGEGSQEQLVILTDCLTAISIRMGYLQENKNISVNQSLFYLESKSKEKGGRITPAAPSHIIFRSFSM